MLHVSAATLYNIAPCIIHSRTKINNINNGILYYAWYLLYTVSLVPGLLRLTVLYTIQYNLPYIIIQRPTYMYMLCKISTVIGSSASLGEVKYPHTERFAPWEVKYGIL